jgi:hypothetical protein
MWFVLSGLTAAFVVGFITTRVSRNTAVDIAVADALDRSTEGVRTLVEPVLTDAAITGDPVASAILDEVVRTRVVSDSLVSVKLWRADGTVVYSTEPRLVGQRFELDPRGVAVFAGGPPLAHVSDVSAPENQFDTGRRLLEVYLLSSTREGTPLLYETYYEYSGVTAVADRLTQRFTTIAITAVMIAVLIQIPLALTLAARLRSRQRERERLLAHAMATSDAERRRIADGLHLGPLQSLVASAMSLAAASRTTDGSDLRLEAASAGINESMRSLRSLLADLATPELPDSGVENALKGLLRRLEDYGITTEFSVESDGTSVGPNTARLLYRTAQELVRDELGEGTAPSIQFRLRVDHRSLELLVSDNRAREDDARLVSPADVEPTSVLASLRDLIADAGGSLTTVYEHPLRRWTRVQLPLLEQSELVVGEK